MKYGKNYRRSALPRKIIAGGLSAVFSAGVFSGCAGAVFNFKLELTGEDLIKRTHKRYVNKLDKLKGFVPKKIRWYLKDYSG